MSSYSEHADGVREVMRELGDDCPSIRWNGADYKLIPGSVRCTQDLVSGGFDANAPFSAESLVETFLSDTITTPIELPAAMLQTRIDYLDEAFKVVAVHIAPGGLQCRIEATLL